MRVPWKGVVAVGLWIRAVVTTSAEEESVSSSRRLGTAAHETQQDERPDVVLIEDRGEDDDDVGDTRYHTGWLLYGIRVRAQKGSTDDVTPRMYAQVPSAQQGRRQRRRLQSIHYNLFDLSTRNKSMKSSKSLETSRPSSSPAPSTTYIPTNGSHSSKSPKGTVKTRSPSSTSSKSKKGSSSSSLSPTASLVPTQTAVPSYSYSHSSKHKLSPKSKRWRSLSPTATPVPTATAVPSYSYSHSSKHKRSPKSKHGPSLSPTSSVVPTATAVPSYSYSSKHKASSTTSKSPKGLAPASVPVPTPPTTQSPAFLSSAPAAAIPPTSPTPTATSATPAPVGNTATPIALTSPPVTTQPSSSPQAAPSSTVASPAPTPPLPPPNPPTSTSGSPVGSTTTTSPAIATAAPQAAPVASTAPFSTSTTPTPTVGGGVSPSSSIVPPTASVPTAAGAPTSAPSAPVTTTSPATSSPPAAVRSGVQSFVFGVTYELGTTTAAPTTPNPDDFQAASDVTLQHLDQCLQSTPWSHVASSRGQVLGTNFNSHVHIEYEISVQFKTIGTGEVLPTSENMQLILQACLEGPQEVQLLEGMGQVLDKSNPFSTVKSVSYTAPSSGSDGVTLPPELSSENPNNSSRTIQVEPFYISFTEAHPKDPQDYEYDDVQTITRNHVSVCLRHQYNQTVNVNGLYGYLESPAPSVKMNWTGTVIVPWTLTTTNPTSLQVSNDIVRCFQDPILNDVFIRKLQNLPETNGFSTTLSVTCSLSEPASEASQTTSKASLSPGAIAGIVVAVLLYVVTHVLCFYYLYQKRKSRSRTDCAQSEAASQPPTTMAWVQLGGAGGGWWSRLFGGTNPRDRFWSASRRGRTSESDVPRLLNMPHHHSHSSSTSRKMDDENLMYFMREIETDVARTLESSKKKARQARL